MSVNTKRRRFSASTSTSAGRKRGGLHGSEHGLHALGLIIGAENGRSHQPREVRAVGNHGLQGHEIPFQRIDGVLFLRQFENRRCIPPGQALICCLFLSHVRPSANRALRNRAGRLNG